MRYEYEIWILLWQEFMKCGFVCDGFSRYKHMGLVLSVSRWLCLLADAERTGRCILISLKSSSSKRDTYLTIFNIY